MNAANSSRWRRRGGVALAARASSGKVPVRRSALSRLASRPGCAGTPHAFRTGLHSNGVHGGPQCHHRLPAGPAANIERLARTGGRSCPAPSTSWSPAGSPRPRPRCSHKHDSNRLHVVADTRRCGSSRASPGRAATSRVLSFVHPSWARKRLELLESGAELRRVAVSAIREPHVVGTIARHRAAARALGHAGPSVQCPAPARI